MSTIGFVQKINTKSGTGRNGKPYTLYSMKLADKDGNELAGWYQCGFESPPCKEGDYVKLEATPKGNNHDVVKGSIKVSKNPPARAKSASAPRSGGGGGTGGGGWSPAKDAKITFMSARNAAIETVKILLAEGGLKLRKGDTKAIASANFDLIMESIDKVTVEYFRDVIAEGHEDELRKLGTVADAGTVTAEADDPVPEDEEVEDEFEADDDGFEDAGDADDEWE